MTNIWIVNHTALPPELGGLNRHFYFSKYLTGLGYNVRLITASAIHNTDINMIGAGEKKKYTEKTFSGVPYTFIKTSGYTGNGRARAKDMLEFFFRFLRVSKHFEKPDIIYASSPDPFAAAAAVRAAKKLKAPVIVEIRDLWPESIVAYLDHSCKSPVIRLMYRMEKWLYRRADRLIFTMEGGADYIREKGWEDKIDLSKLRHVNNGVDLEKYKSDGGTPFHDADLEDERTFKVMYTGSVRTAYRLENVAAAAKLLQDTHPDIRFFIWGSGDRHDDLTRYCRENGVANMLFKGRVDAKHLPYILSKADATLLQLNDSGTGILRFGCSPNKLFEYFAAGRPVIVNFDAGYDLVRRYECGETTDGTPEALARAVLRIRELSKDDYSRLCGNAARAAKDYDYRALTERLDLVLRELL